MLWVLNWAVFALSTGVVWTFARTGALQTGEVCTRAIVVFLAVALSTVLLFLFDALGGVAQHAWDQYPWNFARKIVALAAPCSC